MDLQTRSLTEQKLPFCTEALNMEPLPQNIHFVSLKTQNFCNFKIKTNHFVLRVWIRRK
jgi:hypothetical protein